MYTIKQASFRTGVPATSLRAWERRYGVVQPHRSASGYRLYDDEAVAALTAMRRLVDQGWSPAAAATAVMKDQARAEARTSEVEPRAKRDPATLPTHVLDPEAGGLAQEFLDAAAAVDVVAVESVLDRAFALGPFETVVDAWLMPSLCALGDAWADGRVDVAGEHAASYAVVRRLSQSFAAAASLTRGPRVVIGLPRGSRHELGALAFATAARRRGLAVVYVGADLPVESWQRAVRAFPTRVAVLGVPTAEDRPTAVATARTLLDLCPDVVVAAGGRHADDLAPGVVRLPGSITDAAATLAEIRR